MSFQVTHVGVIPSKSLLPVRVLGLLSDVKGLGRGQRAGGRELEEGGWGREQGWGSTEETGLTCVRLEVTLIGVIPCKSLLAMWTLEWTFSCVQSHVLYLEYTINLVIQ